MGKFTMQGTVVNRDAGMNFFFSFFPKTGHFEHIIRHDIKNFEKKIKFFSFGFLKSLI
jgi:hypothetical protein